jgi:hypothetical protein
VVQQPVQLQQEQRLVPVLVLEQERQQLLVQTLQS